jgi:hypothetical protein
MIHSAAVIAGQLNIFDIVEEETTLGELAAKTGADELLLREYPSVSLSNPSISISARAPAIPVRCRPVPSR